MSATDESMPEALRRALPLLTNPPATPDISHGYLDLLGEQPGTSSGPIQSLWDSSIGSAFYGLVQPMARRVVLALKLPESAVRVPPGSRVLDVGCGPGNVTATLGDAVGPSGLVLGLDISAPMLQRAAHAEAGPNVGFLRADARDLPFGDGTFDAVISLLALQLIPEPLTTLRNMVRVLAPGAPLTILVPTAADTVFHRISDLIGNKGGIEFFDPEEISEMLLDNDMRSVHTRQSGTFLWIMARKAE